MALGAPRPMGTTRSLLSVPGAKGAAGAKEGADGNPTEKVEDCATFVVRAEAHQEVAAALGKLSYKRIR